MGADVDCHVAGPQEPAQLIHVGLDLGGRDPVGAGVQPAGDLDPAFSGEVVRLDHESEGLGLRLEPQKVNELLGFQRHVLVLAGQWIEWETERLRKTMGRAPLAPDGPCRRVIRNYHFAQCVTRPSRSSS